MIDKELQDRIYKDAEQIQIPESLHPDVIEKILHSEKKRPRRWVKVISAIAACLVLGIIGVVLYQTDLNHRDNYDALYGIISKAEYQPEGDMLFDAPLQDRKEKAVEDSVSKNEVDGRGGDPEDFSGTNTQVEGVDEGDLIKTDGKYIYSLNADYGILKIIKADKGRLKEAGKIQLDSQEQQDYLAKEVYVNDEELVIIGVRTPENFHMSQETVILTYNIKDKQNPKRMGSVVQGGDYSQSRRVGDYLYTFSNFTADGGESREHKAAYIPSVENKILSMKDIRLPEKPSGNEYLVMTAVNLKNPAKVMDKKAIFGGASTFYVSKNNIYTASQKGYSRKGSQITKYAYKDGQFTFAAKGSVKGIFDDSFSMDEYQGNLRLVTTLYSDRGASYNNVYVLDHKLKELGSILKLAQDERIYSARFMGDMGYFVTFRETDPLFSVDLSDPGNPKIIGALKIPGFSEYLHFYGKDRLLGIGKSVDGQSDIKLSMFDISDPANVKEIAKHIVNGGDFSEALSDHNAVMIDAEKNIFGFCVETGEKAEYQVYSYKNEKFKKLASIKNSNRSIGVRGLYIKDYFYLIDQDRVRSYDLKNFKPHDDLKI